MKTIELAQELSLMDSNSGLMKLVDLTNTSAEQANLQCFLLDQSSGNFLTIPNRENILSFDAFSCDEADLIQEVSISDNPRLIPLNIHRGPDLIAKAFVLPKDDESVGPEVLSYISERLRLISFLYNRRQYERLVKGLNRPIVFDTDQETFFSDLRKTAQNCSGVQFGAFRTKQDNYLRCIFTWGFEDEVDNPDEMSISVTALPPVEKAMSTGQPEVVSDLAQQYPEMVEGHPYAKRVVSLCATPVNVGGNIEGVITFGVSNNYQFSDTEIQSFLCIANGLGVSINNFKQNLRGRTVGSQYETAFTSMVGVEVAALIRHNIYKTAGNIISLSSAVKSNAQSSSATKSQKERIIGKVDIIASTAEHISNELTKMKDVMSVDRTVSFVNVRHLWDECCSYLDHRISELGIIITGPSDNKKIPMMGDVTKHIFHNLLLNSIDALEQKSGGKKEISLRLEGINPEKKEISLIYADNGHGLDAANLTALRSEIAKDPLSDVSEGTPLGELIFRQRLSTKKDGTGYGLFLCRRMTGYHNGSIATIPSFKNEGLGFRIQLSYDLREIQKKNAEPLTVINESKRTKEVLNVEAFIAQHKLD